MAKGKDELSSFKISDLRKPNVRSTAGQRSSKSAAKEEEPPSISAGFPLVEGWLESGSADKVADALRPSYEKLEELSRTGDQKLRGPAKKAMGAYERTADLFEYLFSTKDAIAKSGG
ncbi:MAG: hypothetical protein HY791_39330 [Deltaproteobacteria bacterium]|nr:hypothetical protein [Deltaproteobacteria bacterium]